MALFCHYRLICISPDTSYTDFSVISLFSLSRLKYISPDTSYTDFSVHSIYFRKFAY